MERKSQRRLREETQSFDPFIDSSVQRRLIGWWIDTLNSPPKEIGLTSQVGQLQQ